MLANHNSVWAETDEGGQLDMKEARKQAAQRPRRVIYNNDGNDIEAGGTPEQFLADRLQQLINTQVDSVFYCTGHTNKFSHLTQVAENYGEFISDDEGDARALNWRNNIRTLKAAGHDMLTLAADFCQENGLEIIFSLRMNDIHDSFMEWRLSPWKREHPQYLLGKPEDLNAYEDSDPRRYWSALDYEVPEVREYIFRILEDVCQRYDVDGIELDWLRHPKYFRPTHDLQPTELRHLAIMNDFMHRVRTMTERVAQERGRPLLVACRVPLSVECSVALGLDVVTWLEEDLLDILVVGGGYVPLAMAPQAREMTELGHSYGVPVYPCISASGMAEEHASVEAWRAAAMNIWHAGADGVYTFNLFPGGPDERLSQMGSAETLRGLDKLYGVDCMDVANYAGYQRAGLVAPGRLPVELPSDAWAQVRLPVGEDIVANAPVGKTTQTRLRLRVASLTQGDELNVKLNGQALGTAAPAQPLGAEPDMVWLERKLDPNLLQTGQNLVEVQLATAQELDEPPLLDRLDLIVQYR